MSDLGVIDLPTYLLGTLVIVLLPGPNSLFVLGVAARRGVAQGFRAAGGVVAGDLVLMVLASGGVASLLRAYPPAFLAFKYIGAGYLAWIGIGMLRGAWARRAALRPGTVAPRLINPAALEAPTADRQPDAFRKALLISLLNPKAILFFMAFFIQFVDPAYPHPAVSFGLLGLIAQSFSLLYLSSLIFAGARLAARFQRQRRLSAVLSGGAGSLFLGFSAKLATASLT